MSAIVITGLPGTGKTHLATALAADLLAAGHPTFVLHTDILKVTLRQQFPYDLKGPGYASDFECKVSFVRPYLESHIKKARQDGYLLIIEGTLALNLFPEPGLHIVLAVSEPERQKRVKAKSFTARRSLVQANLGPYDRALQQQAHANLLKLNAETAIANLVTEIRQHLPPLLS